MSCSAFADHHRGTNNQSPVSTFTAGAAAAAVKVPQSPVATVNQLAHPFMRPFEDSYASTKNIFLSSLSDNLSNQSATVPNSLTVAAKLPNFFESFPPTETSDSAFSDPLCSAQAIAEMNTYPLAVSANPSSSSSSNNAAFKPFLSYPYDLIQFPPFKNHLVNHDSLSPTPTPTPPKKAKSVSVNRENTLNDDAACHRSAKTNRSVAATRPKHLKPVAKRKKNVLVASATESNSLPLNLSVNESLLVNADANANANANAGDVVADKQDASSSCVDVDHSALSKRTDNGALSLPAVNATTATATATVTVTAAQMN